jgi:hypothetical protein
MMTSPWAFLRRAAHRLDERATVPEEAFLVGVEDRDERDLGDVEALAQEVDADEDVDPAHAQVADDVGRGRASRCRSACS